MKNDSLLKRLGLLLGTFCLFFVLPLDVWAVSGSLTSDQTWSGTVEVTGNVTVPQGYNLYIDAGTVVSFADGTGLTIDGGLELRGSQQQPIKFTSSTATPQAGSWSGITINSGSSTQAIHDLEIRYAANGLMVYAPVGAIERVSVLDATSYGLYVSSVSPPISNVTLTGSGSSYGLYLSSSQSAVSNVTVSGFSYGILLSFSSTTVTGCSITRSGNFGIYTEYSNATITGNTISDSANYGILVYSGAPVIRGNQVLRSNQGIYAGSCTTVAIDHNVVRDSGLFAIKTYYCIDASIGFNTIETGSTGIEVTNGVTSYSATVSSNIITHCAIGINWDGNGSCALSYNDLWSNQGNYSGISAGGSDLVVDPQFVDDLRGDVRLASGSPLMSAGAGGSGIGAFVGTPQPPTLVLREVSSQPTLSGTLARDEIWSGTVEVTGNVTVPQGYNLYIDPGTVVRFADGTGLTIDGRLELKSTQQQPIKFTSSAATPQAGNWSGITINGGSSTQAIRDIEIRYATNGLLVYAPVGAIERVSVLDATSYGLYVGSVSPTISNVTLTGSGSSYGLYLSSSQSVVANVAVSGFSYGISLFSSNATVSGCTVSDSGSYGIYSQYGSPVIRGNQVFRSSRGIAIHYGTTATIDHNVLRDNGISGIEGYYYSTATIGFNTVVNCGQGILLTSYGGEGYSATVSSNIIAHCTTGITWNGQGSCTLSYNDLWGNLANYSGITAGSTDLAVDPQFVDDLRGDLRLSSGSPLLVAGEGGSGIGAYVGNPQPPVVLRDVSTEPTVTGNLTRDEIWSGTVDVTGNVTVPQGYNLYIEPGTVVRFADGTGLTVNGRLESRGTQQQPIRFTSSAGSPQAGSWSGITINGSNTPVLHDLEILYSVHGLMVYAPVAVIERISVSDSRDFGIYLSSSNSTVSGCTVSRSGSYGMYLYASNATVSGCTVSDSGSYGIYSQYGSPVIRGNQVFRSSRGIAIHYGTTAMIEHNVLRDNGISGIEGYYYSTATIGFNTVVNCGQGILLTSYGGEGYSATVSSNIIAHCTTGITWNGQGTCTLSYNDLWGNLVNYSGITAGSMDLAVDPQFVDDLRGDFRHEAGSPLLVAGADGTGIGAYVGNQQPPVVLRDVSTEPTVTGNLTRDEIWSGTVDVTGSVTVPQGYNLYIEPGTVVRFADGTGLTVNGRLESRGTQQQPIRFTSSTGSPQAGSWSGITINGSNTPVLHDLEILYSVHGLMVNAPVAVIQRISVSDSRDFGIYLSSSNSTVSGCTISRSGSYGIYLTHSNATVTGCTVSDSGSYGIYAQYGSPVIRGNQVFRSFRGITIYNYINSSPTIEHNVLRDNAISGIEAGYYSTATIGFNTVVNCGEGIRLTSYGGEGYSATVSSNIIAYCTTGITWNGQGSCTLSYNDLWGNVVNYSGLTAGATDLAVDPQFVDDLQGDSRLASGSPLLVAGVDASGIGAYVGSPQPPVVLREVSTQPTVTGSLTRDEIWSGTVDVTGSVTVPPGYNLYIEPGTVVRFSDGTGLTVNGSLESRGTQLQPVRFTSSAGTPQPGIWQGVTIGSGSTRPALHDIEIHYAANGLTVSAPVAAIERVSVLNSSNHGIYLSYSNAKMSGCTVSDSGSYGIYSQYGSPVIRGNQVFRSSRGIAIYYGTAATIEHNVLRDNGISGIEGYYYSTATIGFNTVVNCGQGILLTSYGGEGYSATVTSNIIAHCTTGITWNGQGTCTLSYNDLWGNLANYSGITAGSTDLAVDPQFVDSLRGDFRHEAGSPLLVAGADGTGIGAYVGNPQPPVVLRDVSTEPTVTGNLTRDEIWSGTVDVTGNVTVPQGYNLYIDPGTVVRFADGTGLTVNGRLESRGTQQQPIRFTSSAGSPQAGSWSGITIGGSSASSLHDMEIRYSLNGLMVYAPVAVVERVSVVDSSSFGIYLSSSNSTVSGCTVSRSGSYGMYLYASNATVSGCTVIDSGSYGIYSQYGSPVIRGNQVFRSLRGIAVYNYNSGSATIEHNVLRDNAISGIEAGYYSTSTIGFNTVVNCGQGILLTSYGGEGYSATVSSNIIAHCTTGITWNGQGTCTLSYNDLWGNLANYSGITAGSTDLAVDPQFVDDLRGDLRLSSGSPLLVAGADGTGIGAYVGSPQPPVVLREVSTEPTVAGNLTRDEIWSGTVDVTGSVTVPQGYNLYIDPGTVVRFADGTGLTVNGRLELRSIQQQPIKFTSSAATPQAGSWSGITIGSGSGTQAIRDIEIQYATNGLMVYAPVAAIERVSVLDSVSFGLYLVSLDSEVKGCTVIRGGSYGIYLANSKATVTQCTVNNVSSYGVYILGGTPKVLGNSVSNTGFGIWGQPSGPITVRNNIVKDNSSYGVTIYGAIGGSDISFNSIINSTRGLDLTNTSSTPVTVSSNIISVNSVTGIASVNGDTGLLSLAYNDVWGNTADYTGVDAGGGDISSDPLFVASDDFHLKAGSPGIDAADPFYFDTDGTRADMGAYGGLGGDNSNPNNARPVKPVNAAPADGSANQNPGVTLTSSVYSDPDSGDFQTAAQWQIRTESGSYASPQFDSGTDQQNLRNITILWGTLQHGASYAWRVRYRDNKNAWSDYSQESSFTVITDSTPPDTYISELPTEGATIGSSATFYWSGNDSLGGPLSYSYRLDQGDWSGYSSLPLHSFTALAHGVHLLSVTARDFAGNADPTPALRNFLVDAHAPQISSTSLQGTKNVVTVRWTTDEPSTSQVNFGTTPDYGSSTPSNSALVTEHFVTINGLSAATLYHVRVRSTDAYGNEAVSGDYTVTTLLDSLPPDTSITQGPAAGALVNTSQVSLYWSGSDDVTSVEELAYAWRLDSGAWSSFAASTYHTLTALAEGPHAFEVKARDMSGNEDPTPAGRSFTVDTVAPAAPIVNEYGSLTAAASVTITGSKESGSWLYLNGVKLSADQNETSWSTSSNLSEGTNSFSFTTHDDAGNVSQAVTATIIRDTLPPSIGGSTPAASAFVADLTTIAVSLNEIATAVDPAGSLVGATVADLTGAALPGNWTVLGGSLLFTPSQLPIPEGLYTVHLNPVDTSGNRGSVSFSFTLDRTSPVLTELTTSPVSPIKGGLASLTITFAEDMDTAQQPALSFSRGGLYPVYTAAGSWIDSRSWRGTYLFSSATGDGSYDVTVKDARDRAGNAMTQQVAGSFALDATPPELLFVHFDDADGSGTVTLGDRYFFGFSKVMNDSGLSSNTNAANLNLAPEGKRFGTINDVSWNASFTEVRIRITPGFILAGTEVVHPSNAVTDLAGNPVANSLALNLLDVVPPEVSKVKANFISPVSATSAYRLTVQFNSSMSSAYEPLIELTSSSGTNPTVPGGGTWQTTLYANDTYTSPAILLSQGMDGTLSAQVSKGRDWTGNNQMAAASGVFQAILDATPPTNPNVSVVSASCNSATLSWPDYAAPPDLGGYQIYRSAAGSPASVDGVSFIDQIPSAAREYTAGSLSLDVGYDFAVVAIDKVGNFTPTVLSHQVKMNRIKPPAVPISVANGANPDTAVLSWVGYGTGSLCGFEGFRVYVEPSAFASVQGLTPAALLNAGTLGHTLSGLDRTRKQYIAVIGYNSAGEFNDTGYTNSWSDPLAGDITSDTSIGAGALKQIAVNATLTVRNGAKLTILPGTSLYFAQGAGIVVENGALHAAGTPLKPILLSSYRAAVADGTPAPGDWLGVTLGAGDTGSVLDQVFIEYGAGLRVNNHIASVSAFTARFNSGAGLEVAGAGSSLTTTEALLRFNAVGAQASSGALLTLAGSVIKNNAVNAKADSGGMVATGNWWGATSAEAIAGSVTGNVDYSGHLAYEPVLSPALGTASGQAQFGSRNVELILASRNAEEMRLSEDSLYPGVFYSPLAPATYFLLSPNDGQKTVYAQFRSPTGTESPAVSLTLDLVTVGPTITEFSLSEGEILTRPSAVTGKATAPLGLAALEFYVDDVRLDVGSLPSYSYGWDLRQLVNGTHRVKLRALDSAGNATVVERSVVVQLGAPPAPVITEPVTGKVVSSGTILIAGSAERNLSVQVRRNNHVVGSVTVDQNGHFEIPYAPLVDGQNQIVAQAVDLIGVSPESNHVTVTLDTGPPAPVLLNSASVIKGTGIQLAWQYAQTGEAPTSFRVYRHTQSFSDLAQATLLSGPNLTGLSYTDPSPPDGSYHYGIVGLDGAGNQSVLSNLVSVSYDGTPPVIAVSYSKPSPVGAGLLGITLTSSEPLAAKPALTIRPYLSAVPVSPVVTRVDDFVYTATYQITESTLSGSADVTVSARDFADNAWAGKPSGPELLIDTVGPSGALTRGTPDPVQVLNDMTLAVTLTLDEPAAATAPPTLGFTPPAGGALNIPLTGGGVLWSGTLPLTTAMGSGLGHFTLSAQDQLGNAGTRITSGSTVELYTTEKPVPADPPSGVNAVSVAGGGVQLSWTPVVAADGYAVYRRSGACDTAPADSVAAALATAGYLDIPPADGSYCYAVTSLRRGAESTLSTGAAAQSDRLAPEAPRNLSAILAFRGVRLSWDAPASGESPASYAVRRNGIGIGTVNGGAVGGFGFTDYPSVGGSYSYTIAALDGIGNETVSAPAPFDLSVGAVNNLQAFVALGSPPALSWENSDPAVAGYNVYRGGTRLNSAPLTAQAYSDLSYSGSSLVQYQVKALNGAGVESPARQVSVYPLTLSAVVNPDALGLARPLTPGFFNRFRVVVSNLEPAAPAPIDKVQLRITENGVQTSLTEQNVGQPVAFGSPSQQDLTVSLGTATVARVLRLMAIGQSDDGSAVTYQGFATADSIAARLPWAELSLDGPPLAGGYSFVHACLVNQGAGSLDVVVNRNNGSEAGDLFVSVLNREGVEIGRGQYKGYPAGQIIRSYQGSNFVRVTPGSRLCADIQVMVPEGLDTGTTLTFVGGASIVYDNLQGLPLLAAGPLTGSTQSGITLSEYRGTAAVTKSSYANDEVIEIRGQALDRVSGQPRPNVPLKVGFSLRGSKWFANLTTDAEGNYAYQFQPATGMSGEFTVWAAHPAVYDTIKQASFSLYRVYLTPASGAIRSSKNGSIDFSLQLINPSDLPLSGFSLQFRAYTLDGSGDEVAVTSVHGQAAFAPGFVLGPNGRENVTATLTADVDAPDSVFVEYVLVSSQGASQSFPAEVTLLPAVPVLDVQSPATGYVHASLARGTLRNVSVTVKNSGLADLTGTTVRLPQEVAWMGLSLAPDASGKVPLGNIRVGESRTFDVVYVPPADTAFGDYHDVLVVEGTNTAQNFNINLYATITSSEQGSVLFSVLDLLGKKVEGATVRLANDIIHQDIASVKTDANGEVLVQGINTGKWSYQVSAPGHSGSSDLVEVSADNTSLVEVELMRALVTVSFSVVQVPFTDRYEIKVEQSFETHVPVPVLIVEPAFSQFNDVTPGFETTVLLKVTNFGLKGIDNLKLLPDDTGIARSEPLITFLPRLNAMESIEVPYHVTYRGTSENALPAAAETCEGGLGGLLDATQFLANLSNILLGSSWSYWSEKERAIATVHTTAIAAGAVGMNLFRWNYGAGKWGTARACSIASMILSAIGGLESDVYYAPRYDLVGPGGGPVSGCFAEGTGILMADGSKKRIETIEAGDRVMAYDGGKAVVTHSYSRQSDHVREIRYRFAGSRDDGRTYRLETTDDHLFWSGKDEKWVPGRTLMVGDLLVIPEAGYAEITDISRSAVPTTVHNIDVAGYESFFANGVLAHQKCGGASETEANAKLKSFLGQGRERLRQKLFNNAAGEGVRHE